MFKSDVKPKQTNKLGLLLTNHFVVLHICLIKHLCFIDFLAHTPDNSFLGIAIPSRSHNVSVEKANYAVLYGKSPSYFKVRIKIMFTFFIVLHLLQTPFQRTP